jgi:phospholipase/carboxylesterase
MKKRFSIIVILALAFLPGLISSARAQVAPSKPMDPGWFIENNARELQKFWIKADSLYWAGRHEEAIVSCLEVLRLDGKHQGAAITIASCYGLLGKDTLSALFLTRSWDLGYNKAPLIENDHDFDKVRQSPVFKNTFDSLVQSAGRLDSLEGERAYIPAPALSYYRVKLPKGYDSRKRYTLLVTLHGYGGNLDRHFGGVLKKMPEPDFIFASLQAPYPVPAARESFRWKNNEYGPEREEQSVKMSADYVANVIRTLKAKYNPLKTFLMGHSEGAWMSYNAGLSYPKLFDGLIAFGGWVDSARINDAQIKNAKKLKVLIVHGRNDKAVPYSSAEKSRDRLKAGGVDVTFFDFDGGHEMPEAGVKKVYEWIRQ